jgi:hypothetical protein
MTRRIAVDSSISIQLTSSVRYNFKTTFEQTQSKLFQIIQILACFSVVTSGFMDRVEDGSVLLTANEFPSFLYGTGTQYDEDNEDFGLFRGYLLVRVCMLPTAAMQI